jgi:hypothetical protein
MASENAKNVAKEVLETLGSGTKVSLRKIAKKNGYAQNTADSPKNITETKSYQDIISPVVDKMIAERDRIIAAMSQKDLTKEKHKDLGDTFDKLTKNIQLLNGGKTSNDSVKISWE